MKKVLIITYYWPPSGGAGVQRWLKFVKYFSEFGIEPIVLTVETQFASYPQMDESLLKEVPSTVKVIRTRTSEPFDVYKKISGRKQIPSGGFATGNTSFFLDFLMRFIRGNFFIPDARKGWNKYAYRAACEIIAKDKPEVIITSSPPHSTQLIGLQLKKKFNITWIADFRDPWTDIYYYKKMLHTSIAKAIDKKYERRVLKNADKIVTVSEAIKNLLLQKSALIKKENISVIPNGYDENDFKDKNIVYDSNRFIITYTGTITESYAPYSFFDTIALLIKNNPGSNILFRLIGSMPQSIQMYFKAAKWSKNFNYIPYSPHDKVIDQILSSSLLYLAIPNIAENKGILTGKLFEYLASGVPILATGPTDGEAANIIRSCGAGRMFDTCDKKGMLDYLQEILNDHKIGKTNFIRMRSVREYSRRVLAEKFSKLITM